MSVKYADALQWRENPDWYFYDEERERFFLTSEAPDRVRQSFELWQSLVARKARCRELEDTWRENPDWYFYDEERERFFLTSEAPDRVRQSFELWRNLVES